MRSTPSASLRLAGGWLLSEPNAASFQEFLGGFVGTFCLIAFGEVEQRRLFAKELRVIFHDSLEQPGLGGVAGRGDAQRVGHEREPRPLPLVLGDQPQQDAILERAPQEQIADDRIVLLSVPVDAAVALLQTIGIERQFQVDQMVAPLLQIQALGRWLLSFGNSLPRITESASFSTVFATPATLLWTLVRCNHGVGEFVHGRCVVANRIAARTVHRVRTIRVLQRPIGVGNAGSCVGTSRSPATPSCRLPDISGRLRHGGLRRTAVYVGVSASLCDRLPPIC